ncbi:hypothetical protein CDL15_Pgr013927 [Punica granatum]|nr:hypothetical protein CDL15_Pgr013927 [Punica granatum]PKI72577.1 hypothetical protein CRG98_006954 [Punica granatum]
MVAHQPSDDIKDHGTFSNRKGGRVRCNYCQKEMQGLRRLKFHLGGVKGDGTTCLKVPANVRELYQNEKFERKKHKYYDLKRDMLLLDPLKELPQKRNCSQRSYNFKGTRPESDSLIGISTANLTSFQEIMYSTTGDRRSEYKSYQEVKGSVPQAEVTELQDYVKRTKQSWSSTGCSILLDTWRNGQGQDFVIFLVDCSEGPIYLQSSNVSSFSLDSDAIQSMLNKVIEEVGAQNVVQIIACSTAGWLGTMEKQFMEKCKTGFWTVSASHCVELMLEKMALMDSVQPVLEKAASLTKFMWKQKDSFPLLDIKDPFSEGKSAAIPFMTLENIVAEEEKLITASEWKASVWASTEGKMVYKLFRLRSFWSEARMVLKASVPLVRLLALIHRADKPLMGYIYETMDRVKEAIKMEFEGKTSEYMPFWKVIDEIWDKHLHSPLHAAGYYLNPNLFYSSNFHLDTEVAFGLLCCIVRLVRDENMQDQISQQLDEYLQARGDFEEGSSIRCRDKPPLEWWSKYGTECPELQRFAIYILSQTCDGPSRYGLNKEMARKLLTSEMNCVDQQEQAQLRELTFYHYNLQLLYSKKHRGEGNSCYEDLGGE